MLRVVVVEGSTAAKSYYSRGDYYAEKGQELPGVWGGRGSERLGLSGEVTAEAFERLCDNVNPETGHALTAMTRADRRVGYDINFHVPKSVSVAFGLTNSQEILDAFRQAAEETLRELESDARTRVRTGGRQDTRKTGELVWASFIHTTSRPVDGIPDPHLHLHAVAFNATFDPVEKRWKAIDLGDVKRDAPYYEAAFHARLAHRLQKLGFDVVPTAKGRWEIAGVPDRVIREFSRRTRLIEKMADERGITDAKAKDKLGALTRERKRKNLSPDELRSEWMARLSPEEQRAIRLVVGKALDVPAADPSATRTAVEYAVSHCFERQAVVPLRTLFAAALRRGVGQVTVEGVGRELASLGLIVREREGRTFATSRDVLEEEMRMLNFARSGRGRYALLGDVDRELSRAWLGDEQKAVVRHVLGSRDRVVLIRGAAGTGKTALMQEAVEAIEANDKRVVTLAPSAAASRGVLRGEGFQDADTVARFLVDERLHEQARGQVVWVDEAGLLGSRQMAKLFDLAARLDARVILSGDKRQHSSVERGSVLHLLEQEAGLPVAQLVEIRRQSGKYREAMAHLSDGRTLDGFRLLDELGWVKEVPGEARAKLLAGEYVEAVSAGRSALVVSPTHAEGRKVTDAIRSALRESSRLGAEEQTVTRYEAKDMTSAERQNAALFEPGDVVEFHQHSPGFKSGSRCVVVKVGRGSLLVKNENGGEAVLPLRLAERFQVFRHQELSLAAGDPIRVTRNGRSKDKRRLDNGAIYIVRGFTAAGDIQLENGAVISRDWGHLAFGYCVTSHASQGRTVDRVFVAVGSESFPAASREQLYVSASRGRERVTVYTDDKAALGRAVQRADPRLTATDLVGLDPAVGWRAWVTRRVKGVQRVAESLGLVRDQRRERPRAVER